MDLLEHQGKDLFAKHSIPIPNATVYTGNSFTLPDGDTITVKAQVKQGKRADKGGIKLVDREKARNAADKMLGIDMDGETVETILLESAVDIEKELYLSLSIDRAAKQYTLVISPEGGTGIEDVAEEDPDAVKRLSFYEIDEEKIRDALDELRMPATTLQIIHDMYTLMREEDALLVEINPLVVQPDEELVAIDSKVRIDDNALFRHDYEEETDDGMQFVELDGNIGIIGNGAGLVMATIDTISHFGGRPADFLDIGGGADFQAMEDAMQQVINKAHVDGVFINIFGGITKCDEVAKGIIDFVEREAIDIPMVVRMVGTNQEKGRQMLEDNGIRALDSMDSCAEQITAMVNKT